MLPTMANQTDPIRSTTMRAVKSKDTEPEMRVRRMLHSLGYRYRLHRRKLPGCPDLVFPRLRKVILIHGCFWHGHHCARGARIPKTNTDYWTAKIDRNRTRDVLAKKQLKADGWTVLVVWEGELKRIDATISTIVRFLRA
jgi:DNA mismatch endonuclease (patch repair protein)